MLYALSTRILQSESMHRLFFVAFDACLVTYYSESAYYHTFRTWRNADIIFELRELMEMHAFAYEP